ncbi:MAG: protein kinase domain-containing protein [Ktedonobacteraceae bacterium]
MSMTQTTTEVTPSGDPHCQYCGIQLPPQATFCASCGERVIKKQVTSLLQDNQDIAASYRITSLVRRRPYVSLFLATDIRQQRPVALRDINITSLDDEGRSNAADAVQHEYDLLRRQHIPYVIPLIDVRHFQDHLYVVAGWPRDTKGTPIPNNTNALLHTLQDILQSGKGLPEESLALAWIEQLCQSLQEVHASGIVVADMDPQTIILNGDTYASELALMVSWLPPSLRTIFPHTSTIANTTNYIAPEVLLSKPEPRSDIYSLGALLYLLLTGTPPEEPMARTQHRLRLPGELNSRIGTSLDDFIMQALAIDAADRFSSALEMHEALIQLRTGGKRTSTAKESFHRSKANSTTNNTDNTGNASTILPTATEEIPAGDTFDEQQSNDHGSNSDAPDYEQRIEKIVSTDTVLITPLPVSSYNAWQSSPNLAPVAPAQIDPAGGILAETPLPASQEIELDEQDKPNEPNEQDKQDELDEVDTSGFASPLADQNAGNPDIPIGQRFKRHITGRVPAIPRSVTPKAASELSTQNSNLPAPVKPLPVAAKNSNGTQPKSTNSTAGTSSFFKQLQRIFLGEQKQTTTAAAIVETPLRVQPNQHYQIRIHVMGRSWPMGTLESKDGAASGGLSSLVEGDLVSIEVRSALYQNYAYVVQQATVQIPENGYAAEVTIPMHPLSQGPSGRRDRLHIFFMDEKRRSLYEKPFVIELFISHLVQPGREGHNVLTIPF